jgi:hypothetical protein
MKRKESTWLWVQGALAMCFCFLLVSGIILNGAMLWLLGWFVIEGGGGHGGGSGACVLLLLLAACGIVNLVALIKQAGAMRGRSAPKDWLGWKYAGVVLNVSVLAFWFWEGFHWEALDFALAFWHWATGYYEVSDLPGGQEWLLSVMGVCPLVSLLVFLGGPFFSGARTARGGRSNSDKS